MAPKIKGVPFPINGVDHVLPPFSLGIMFDQEELIKFLQNPVDVTTIEYARRAIPLVLATFQRNYPDLTHEEILRGMDPLAIMEALETAFALSGFRPLREGATTTAESVATPPAE